MIYLHSMPDIPVYTTILLSVVLHGCETSSLTLRKEWKQRVIEKENPEVNIWAQYGWDWGVKKAQQWVTP